MSVPIVTDTQVCTGCGLCVYECSALVIDLDPER
jgi:Pyruvate/2-oxoacid:ferredoxin oxidoreductase delta subunit